MSSRRLLVAVGWLAAVVLMAGCSQVPGATPTPSVKATITDLPSEVTRVADEHGGRLVGVSVFGDSAEYAASVTVVNESGLSVWAVPGGQQISPDGSMRSLGWLPAKMFPFNELQAVVDAGFSCPGGESPSFVGEVTMKGALLVNTTCGSAQQPFAQSLAGQPVAAITDPVSEAGISTVLAEAKQVNGLLGVTSVVITSQGPEQGVRMSYRPVPAFGFTCSSLMTRDLAVKGAAGSGGISLGSCDNVDPSKEGTGVRIELLTAPKLMAGITAGAAMLKISPSQVQQVTVQEIDGSSTVTVVGAGNSQVATVDLTKI